MQRPVRGFTATPVKVWNVAENKFRRLVIRTRALGQFR